MRLRSTVAAAIAATLVTASAAAAPPGAGEMEEQKAEGEDAERAARLHVWVDSVFGVGETAVVSQNPVGLGGQPAAFRRDDRAGFTTQNFDVGLSYEILNDLATGVELPLVHGSLDGSRGTQAMWLLGNVELDAEYVKNLTKHLLLVGSLELTLPTATASELPSQKELDEDPRASRDERAYARWSILRAAENVRGWEENHLFAPDRWGIVPRVGVLWEPIHRLEVEPYAKLGSLIGSKGQPYEGDVVLALRASYRLHAFVDVGARVWTNVPIGGSLPQDESPVGVLEPQVRGHFGPILPVVGVVLPFAGPISNPENVGVRLAIASHF